MIDVGIIVRQLRRAASSACARHVSAARRIRRIDNVPTARTSRRSASATENITAAADNRDISTYNKRQRESTTYNADNEA